MTDPEPRPARRLMIIVDEDDTAGHQPVYAAVVERALRCGLAGASVFRGIEGFGSSRTIHTSRILSLSERLPAMIVIVDTAEKIDAFLPQLAELCVRGVVAMDDVDVVEPGATPPAAQP